MQYHFDVNMQLNPFCLASEHNTLLLLTFCSTFFSVDVHHFLTSDTCTTLVNFSKLFGGYWGCKVHLFTRGLSAYSHSFFCVVLIYHFVADVSFHVSIMLSSISVLSVFLCLYMSVPDSLCLFPSCFGHSHLTLLFLCSISWCPALPYICVSFFTESCLFFVLLLSIGHLFQTSLDLHFHHY